MQSKYANTALNLRGFSRRREIEKSKNPALKRFAYGPLPILSAFVAPLAGALAAGAGRTRGGLAAAALGGGVGLAGTLPRLLADVRHGQEARRLLRATKSGEPLNRELRRSRALDAAATAGAASTILAGIGAGMKKGTTSRIIESAGLLGLLPAIGTLVYLNKKGANP